MQPQTQGAENFQHRRKTGVAIWREGFVEPFTAQSGFAGCLRHTTGSSHVPQGLGDECRIVARFFQHGFQIERAVFGRPKMILHIPGGRLDLDILPRLKSGDSYGAHPGIEPE